MPRYMQFFKKLEQANQKYYDLLMVDLADGEQGQVWSDLKRAAGLEVLEIEQQIDRMIISGNIL